MTIEEIMEQLLICMCGSMAEVGWEGDCCLVPGLPSFDTCTQAGGEAYVRLVRMYPSTRFPAEDRGGAMSECMGQRSWALVLELGATHGICDDKCNCIKKAANARSVLGISEAGLRGVICCLDSGPCLGPEYAISQLMLNPPFGGCGGFKIDLTVQHVMPCCVGGES